MLSWVWFWVQLAFAGLWPLIWHWGTGVGIIITCLLISELGASIPILNRLTETVRHDFRLVAAGAAIFLCGGWVMGRDEAKRCEAKTVIIEKHVKTSVKNAQTPQMQAQPDPFDSPDN